MDTIVEVAHRAADALTFGYHVVFAWTSTRRATPAGAVVSTWFLGSLLTLAALGLLAFLWHSAFGALRGRARALLNLSLMGADLKTAHDLADHFARFDRIARRMQSWSHVYYGFPPLRPPSPLVSRPVRARLAGALIRLTAFFRSALLLVRVIITSVAGWLTFLATWWTVGHPGSTAASEAAAHWPEVWASVTAPTTLPLLGASLALATFILSRLWSPTAKGHQAWRRNEATQASEDLAQFEVELASTLRALKEAEEPAVEAWRSLLRETRDRATEMIADHETVLRATLCLPCPRRLQARRFARPFDFRPFLAGPDVALTQARAAVASLETYLSTTPDRQSERMRRSTPRRVFLRTNYQRVQLSAKDVNHLLTPPDVQDPHLTEPSVAARRVVQQGDLPAADAETTLQRQIDDWNRQARAHAVEIERAAHVALRDYLLASAELEEARIAIVSYIHPQGGLSKLLDRLST